MRIRFRSAATSLLVALPGLSHGLGLGDIQLKSALNAPLSAEIELIGATSEELSGLQVQMASRELFSRYGLDYPGFISNIQLRPGRSTDGRDVIVLSSAAPMTEPFATLLVEANVARQRIVREYTVLFDPPVFAPDQAGAAAPAPVAAPVSGAGERSAPVSRPAVSPPATVTGPVAGDTYTVQRGDSLSLVARRVADGSSQAMIAIYDANPAAFEGNINVLRAGSVLRIPDAQAIAAVEPGEAQREVRRQFVAWRAGQGDEAVSQPADARLRLVPPGGGSAQGAGASEAETAQLRNRVSELEAELAESRRLLELRNAELARLQAAGRGDDAIEAPPVAPVAEPVAQPQAQDAPEVAPPAPAAPVTAPADTAPPPAAPAPGLLDRIGSLWYLPVALLVLLLGWLGLRAARRRREDSLAADLEPAYVPVPQEGLSRPGSNTLPLNKPLADMDDQGFVVEESGSHPHMGLAERSAGQSIDMDDAAATGQLPALDATAALDQGDPLAEADFHMAYGLYDQAAHLVQIAIRREPQRRDLKLKLLEVFFVWGDRDQFLQVARELAAARDQAEPGEWEKIVIMGKQLAPDEPLFSQSAAGVGQGSVDLNLEGGQNHVDFDPNGEPGTLAGGVDLDLDSVLGGEADAGQSAALDFTLDGTGSFDDPEMTATTRQMVQPGFGEGNEPTVQTPLTEGPTVEQPQFDPGETLREKLDSQLQAGMADQTAELALDDLGLDLGKLDATGSTLLDDSQLTRALEEPAAGGFDAPTMIASLDDTPHPLVGGGEDDADLQPTELLPLGNATSQEIDLLLPPAEATQSTQILSFDELPEDAGATSRLASLDLGITLEETGTHTSLAATDVGLDPGAPDVPDGGALFAGTDDDNDQTGEARQADLEPITMSEVGTKLDLARAYMDMGDPDGARSILQEVLQEGSMSQRQEAQRLIDSIPG